MAIGGDSSNNTQSDDLNLTEDPSEKSSIQARPLETSLMTLPYDPSKDRERMRGWIAISLVGLLIAIVVLSFLPLWFDCDTVGCLRIDEVKTLLELVLAPVTGLVGAVTGFYFGEKAKG